jgi:hypothetical protein
VTYLSRVWSVKDKSHLLTLAREEGALPTSIAWLTGDGNQVSIKEMALQ